MSCESCQDCGCSDITLPVITGPTGATGATGAAGADGSDGATVLHNDTAQSTTSSTSIAAFSTDKTYTLPANTLATDGSKLILTAIFSTTDLTVGGDAVANIYIDGGNWTAKDGPFTIQSWNADSEAYLKIRLEITRTSTTNFAINSDSYVTEAYTHQTLSHFHYYEATNAISDVSANTIVFQARGKTTGTTSFNCDQLTIDHLVK